MFATWVICKAINPQAIVESGVWKGQSTWLSETTCPNATIHCIDLDLSRREYTSERAVYHTEDFCTLDWPDLPRDRTLLFFDDHQDACARLAYCWWFGFQHIVFEDNYPAGLGDCRSLKQVIAGGVDAKLEKHTAVGVLNRFKRLMKLHPSELKSPYCTASMLKTRLLCYHEFPPLFICDQTRWGIDWDTKRFPTPEPVLSDADRDRFSLIFEDAKHYTWLAFARLHRQYQLKDDHTV